VYLRLCNHRIWAKSFPPCRIQLASRERSSSRPTDESIPQSRTPRAQSCTAPRPCQPDASEPPRGARVGIAFQHARVHTRIAPHPNLHGTARQSQRHRYLAPSSPRVTPSSLKTTEPRLKPIISRPDQDATDTTAHTPGLSARHRPESPPPPANCVRSNPP
jgi:hypothetical protein